MNKFPLLVTTLALMLFASTTLGQGGAAQVQRFERRAQELRRQTLLGVNDSLTLQQRALLQFGGFVGFNFFAIDDQNQNTHILRQTQATAYASLNLDNTHRFFIRSLAIYDDFNSGHSFDNRGDDFLNPILDRATYSFDLNNAQAASGDEPSNWNLNLTAGRQLAHWATGLTLDRTIDGLTTTLSSDHFAIQALIGITPEDSYDFDSSRPNFDDDTKRLFAGAIASYQVTPNHRPFIFGLVQNDRNSEDYLQQPLPFAGNLPTHYHYDSYYLAAGSTGNFGDQLLYAIEAVYQGGDAFSNSYIPGPNDTIISVTQTNDDIHAYALNAQLTYLVADPNHTRAELQLLLASGDNDRNHTSNTFDGNSPNTHDNAFNAFGLIDTGLAFAPLVSNLAMVRTGFSTFPLPNSTLFSRLQIGANFFVFNKLNDSAPIDEITTHSPFLGTEADLFANWQIKSDLSLALRYGVFFPGDAIIGDNQNRHFLFTGLTYAF